MDGTPRSSWALALLLSATVAGTAQAQPPSPSPGSTPTAWTLVEALAQARRESPVLRQAEARLEETRAELLQARTYPYNPEIGVEAAERSGPDSTSTDRGLELSQEIEIGGQRGKRTRAARADLAAAKARYGRAEQELGGRVELAFAQALAEERQVEIARSELALVEDLLSFEERRLEAGAGTQLDLNLARAATGRVLQRLQESLVARAAARAALAEAVGVDPASAPVPVGSGPEPASELPAFDELAVNELTERALAERPDLAASRRDVEAARRQVELQRSLARPNLRAGVFGQREEGDDIVGARVGITIPLLDRNRGGIARARARVGSAEAALAADELAVRRSVAEAHARYRAAAESVSALDALVVGTLEESLALLGRALDAGKISAGEVLLLRRELVEARRQHVQAELDLSISRSDLRLAVGDPSLLSPAVLTPSTPGDL